MKRANKVYCLILALIAASALAVPLVFHQGAGRAGSETALQLDVGSQAGNGNGATADAGGGHVGSEGPMIIGASFAEIEHFSFRPVMGDIDDSHSSPVAALLDVRNMPFPVGAPGDNATPSYGAGAFGSPGAPEGFGGAGMAFSSSFGSTPMRSGAAPSAPGNAAFLPLALPGSDAGVGNGNTGNPGSSPGPNTGGMASDAGPVGLDGAGGTPGNTEGVFNPSFGAPLNDGLPDVADAGGASSVDVPEPATIALFGFGLLGFAASRRRAAKRATR